MRTFILDIIPRIARYSKKLDNITVLTNKHWVFIDEELGKKIVFIFREKSNQLLIAENGIIEKASWEYLGNNSLLIDRNDGSFLFRHGFIDDSILALKVDGKEEYALLINEEKFSELNSLATIKDFLNANYKTDKVLAEPVKIKAPEVKIKFDEKYSLKVLSDLRKIVEKFEEFQNPINVEILISYVRDHKIKSDLVDNHKDVSEMVVYKMVPIDYIEKIFNDNKNNPEFLDELEKFIRKNFK